jgi:hypothetical protein
MGIVVNKTYNDTELISRFNAEVGNKGSGMARFSFHFSHLNMITKDNPATIMEQVFNYLVI